MAVPDQNLDMPSQPADPAYQRELGSGLVLRWSAAADAAGVGRLMGQVWSIGPHEPVNPRVVDGAIRHMSRAFPTHGAGRCGAGGRSERARAPDCGLRGAVARNVGSMPHSIASPARRHVATDPAYRNRGLVRAMFQLLHARCAAEGRLVQAITGIRISTASSAMSTRSTCAACV